MDKIKCTVYLLLDPSVPEYGSYNLEDLSEWYFDFEPEVSEGEYNEGFDYGYTKKQKDKFLAWCEKLQLGIVEYVPDKDGYRILKAEVIKKG